MKQAVRGVELPAEALEEIEAHAAEGYPNEACGVVLRATEAGGFEVRRMRNVQDEMHARDPDQYPRTARTAYLWDAAEALEVDRESERPGRGLVAIYHSHPDHDAYFSDTDLAAATPFGEPTYPRAVQIVVSVRDGEVKETKAFAWEDSEQAYVEVRLKRPVGR